MTEFFLNIVLYQPEIPYNTGNIGRLCVGTNSKLHLIEPLGFKLDSKKIRRSGLDYWNDLELYRYSSFDEFISLNDTENLYFASTKGQVHYYDVEYSSGDYILFGKESGGLPENIHKCFEGKGVLIPMPGRIRSMNLCNSAAIIMYEALRQSVLNAEKYPIMPAVIKNK